MNHFNKLTPAEAERLALLAEECAEVIQDVGKILRHGYGSGHPDGTTSNRENLEIEIGHLLYAIELLECADDIGVEAAERSRKLKRLSVFQYLHHQ